jgi:hypothetical protein
MTRRQDMKRTIIGKGVRIGAVVALFASGWFCGTISQRSAEAELKDIGKAVMEQAGDQGGALGAAAKLGTSISDIQTNLDALQKNVDTLKSVKEMLGS